MMISESQLQFPNPAAATHKLTRFTAAVVIMPASMPCVFRATNGFLFIIKLMCVDMNFGC